MALSARGLRRPLSWASEVRQVAIGHLLREILVACPRCHARTETHLTDGSAGLACPWCGFAARRPYGQRPWPRPGHDGQMTDPWFGAALWLQARCAGHVLWALNFDHLSYIEDYVAAGVRARREFSQFGSALGEQLPTWIVTAKNREVVLRTSARLKRT